MRLEELRRHAVSGGERAGKRAVVNFAAAAARAAFLEHGGEDAKDGFQTDENGQILLGGTKLLPKKAYPHGLRASVTVDYDRATRLFSVTVTVTDAQGTELSSTSFQVEKLNASDEVVVGS